MQRLLEHFDAHVFTQLNQQFHSVLYEPCPNPHILDLVHRGWGRLSNLRDSTFAFVPGRAHHSVEEHTEILDLIRTGADPLEIELAARNHRWRTLDAFLAARHDR
jgi:DNA-binding GntR family transcriptional regulator